MMTTRRDAGLALPSAVRWLVVLVAVAAGGIVVVRGVAQGGAVEEMLRPTFLVLAGLGTVSVAFPIRFYRNGSVQGFSLTAACVFATAMLVPDGAAVLLGGAMAAVGFAYATRSIVKTVFNVSQMILAADIAMRVGRLLFGTELGGDVLAGPTLLHLGLTILVYSLISGVLVSELVARHGEARDGHVREVLAPIVWIGAGDFLVAVLLTILAERSAAAILLAVPMFVGLLLGYRGFAADRENARQAELLHGTSRRLLDGALNDVALARAVSGLREFFGGDRALLVRPDDEMDPAVRKVVDEVHATGEAVIATDPEMLAAPVRFEQQVGGVLVVAGRRGMDEWGAPHLALLSTVAGEIAATLRIRRLLKEVGQERALLAAETSKLTDILASASDGIVVLDRDGRVEACNPAMTDLLGLDAAPIGPRWHEVLHLEDEAERRLVTVPEHPLTHAIMREGEAAHTDAALRRPDGSVRWLRCSVAPVRSDEHERRGNVLVAVDRTKEREVEQLRGDFIATVSHELRTPLTPLRGFLGVLREHGDALDEERRTMMVEAMEKQVTRLSGLIADLLQVAEVDAGAIEVSPQLLDVAATVGDVVEEFELAHPGRVHTSSRPATALADPVALRRIVSALVSNACKHTDGAVVVNVLRRDGKPVVAVDDEGPGIAPSDREVVFQPFRRLGDHLHRPQGPGVGLAVARALAEAQDATLEIVDREGPGTRFELVLSGAVRALEPLSLDGADRVG